MLWTNGSVLWMSKIIVETNISKYSGNISYSQSCRKSFVFMLHDILLSSVGTQKCSFHKSEKSEFLKSLSTEREMISNAIKTLCTFFSQIILSLSKHSQTFRYIVDIICIIKFFFKYLSLHILKLYIQYIPASILNESVNALHALKAQ